VLSACSPPTEVDPAAAPTPWEIRPAERVDAGTSYWPGSQWRTALPAQVGMDSARMAALSRDVRKRKWPTLRSLLIVHGGYLVFNEYVAGAHPDSLVRMEDVSKTVTGLLVGVADREGKLRANEPLAAYFPEYAPLLSAPPKSALGVDDLLTMRSGIRFEDEPYAGSDLELLDRSSQDWLKLIFTLPLYDSPGMRWRFNSGGIIALGGVLRAVTGEAADAYARRVLFAPLGITRAPWITGQPNGLPQMATGLSMTAPDMLRIGYLMLRNGLWNDTPIVSPAWIATMRERKSQQLGNWIGYSLDYGRTLWILPPVPGAGDTDVLAASGFGGHWIFIIPGRDLVVVATSDASTVETFAQPLKILYDEIVASIP
jgi:CubicO group peptidase (beta-lactamase class C family)